MNRMTEKPATNKKAIAAWCLFDFGNSSFTTVIVTTVYNVYFVKQIAPDGGTRLWSIGLLISNLVVLFTAPVIGAIADHGGRKKGFLFLSYLTCIAATACLSLVEKGDVVSALILVGIANTAFASGENLVAAFLPELAEPKDIAKISSWGWGVGYIGGLAALALCLWAINSWGDVEGASKCGIIVAVFFLIGGLPTFVYIKESNRDRVAMKRAIKIGMKESATTIKDRGQLPDLFRFFTAALVLQIGIYGVIQYAGIYGTQLAHLSQADVTLILLVSQISAFIGALASGHIASRIGATNTVKLTTMIWCMAGLLLILKTDKTGFWAAALTAGFAMGASLSTIRAAVALLTPIGRGGEIFGFYGLFGRTAAILAPAGNLLLLHLTNDKLESGIVYFLACFVFSYLLLGRVDEARGRKNATMLSPSTQGD